MNKYGFTLTREEKINEYNLTARLYIHDTTGAQLLSVLNDDENKVFNITFPTIPDNSKGTAHIIEHSVLCGSEKYPVKEPFIELVKGSVNTYLNAGTSTDYTTYPCASTNEKDFYNLIDVYIDAVFHPLLNEDVLRQEGWHYEPENSDGPLKYKGVVFNEMKGAFSYADGYVYRRLAAAILEGTAYQYNSGGDPQEIPDLDFAEFMDFYRKWYHPSNAYIFFYGNDDEDKRLQKMSGYLEGFTKREITFPDLNTVNWSGERNVEFSYPAREPDKDEYYRISGWLMPGKCDNRLIQGFNLLEQVLLGTPASPLRKVLLESGLGEDIFSGGFASHYPRPFFSVGLKGVKKENLEKADKLVCTTLEQLVADGIDGEAVEAALNTYEFKLRENNTGDTPRGLQHSGRIITSWIHNNDPFSPLCFEQELAAIRSRNGYFEDLIKKYLLDNNDKVSFTISPDPGFVDNQEKEEKIKLKKIKSELDEAELANIQNISKALKKAQETPDNPEDIAAIPRLKISDLTKNIKITPCEEFSTQSGVNGFIHDISTNGIMYLDFCFDLHQVPERLLSLVPLFSRSLLLMGNRNEDYSKLIRKIGIHTGGIRLVRITGSHFGNRHAESKLTFRIKLTYAKMDKLKDILASLFTGINWDNRERFNQILLEEKSEYEAGIVPSGHSLVLTRIRSTLSEADWIQEQFGGVSYLQFLRSACERMDSGWDDLCADLQQLYKLIINRKALLINVTTDRKQCRNYNSYINELVSLIPERELGSDDWKFSAAKRNQILATSTQVNYIGTGFALPDNKFNPGGALAVIRKSIGTDYLWNLIRVQGGAYGGFASFDDLSRIFALVSYRDPQFSRTYEVYQKLADYLLNFSIAPEELERIKISVIGDLDMPLLPDALGFISFRRKLLGVNDGYRQQYRDNVFAATEQHFHEFGQIVRSGLENAVKVAMCREDVFMESGFTESDFDIIRV